MNKNTIKIQRKLFTYKENGYMIRKISFAQRIFMNLPETASDGRHLTSDRKGKKNDPDRKDILG